MRRCRQSKNNFALCISAYAHAPVVAKVAHEDYDPNPQYSFAYDVQDSLTGDSKAQHETRSGDVVQGSYSLIDADGFKRTVEYTGTHFSTSIILSMESLFSTHFPNHYFSFRFFS